VNTYLAISSFFNFLVATLLVSSIAPTVANHPVKRRYLYFLLSVTAWSGSYFIWQISSKASVAYFFTQALTIFSSIIPIAFYHFCLALSGLKASWSLRFGYVLCLCLICATPFGLIVSGVSQKFGHQYWPDAGILMPVYLIIFVGYVLLSGAALVYGWKYNVGRRSSDNLFVFLTCLVGFVGGATNFPLWYDIPLQPYGNILVSVYLLLLGYGLYNNCMLGQGGSFYQAVVGLVLDASVALFYILCVSVYRIVLGLDPLEGDEFLLHAIVAFLAGMFAFWGIPLLKLKTEQLVESIFESKRVSALATLRDLPVGLSSLPDTDEICSVAAKSIEETLEVNGVAVFLLEPFASSFCCVYATDRFTMPVNPYEILQDNAVVQHLAHGPHCIALDQVYELSRSEYYDALVRLKNDLGVSVIVPIFSNNEIYGLIFLCERGQAHSWSEEELASLFHVGSQIGVNLRVRDFERRSSEVDKLVALGTMAAGLSHEIRNPLVSVQTLASLLHSKKSLDNMPDGFRSVLIRDIKRIESIVDGVAAFSKNQDGKKDVTRILDVVENSVQIFKSTPKASGITLEVKHEGCDDVEILSNIDQLVQVVLNLLENAADACIEQASPRIEISLAHRQLRNRLGGVDPWVELSVADNGIGIPHSIADRIFEPFITSKDTGLREQQQGMGLGLAISKCIVENHGGAISVVDSQWDGAKFVILLKVFTAVEN
jgi:two-component system nitrogen regulation sensor histidine kinase GlnL